jgi:hypothetical protein
VAQGVGSEFKSQYHKKTKINFNVISEMVKLTQKKLRSTLDHIGIGNNFMTRTPIAQQ